jgi:hypothetical protein
MSSSSTTHLARNLVEFGKFLLGTLVNNVESVAIKNNGGNPQIVVMPKNAAKDLLKAAKEVIENGKATQEGKEEGWPKESQASSSR